MLKPVFSWAEFLSCSCVSLACRWASVSYKNPKGSRTFTVDCTRCVLSGLHSVRRSCKLDHSKTMSCFGCLSMSAFKCSPMRVATIRASPQAKKSNNAEGKAPDEPREKVLVLFGDSNFHYRPEKTFLSTWLGWPPESTGDMVRARLSGRVILASSSCLDFRETTMQLVQTSLETVKSLCANIDIYVLVLCGQNDADSTSRRSTRNFDEAREKFRQLVEEKVQKLEKAIPYATIYWVTPFDDPTATFTEQYVALVKELRNVICLRERVVTFGPFSSFEADKYHLVTKERTEFANQVLEWFAAL